MKRLVVILLVLAVVLVAAALRMRREPGLAGNATKRLSPAEQERLEAAEQRFAKEKNKLLGLRKSRAPAAELAAQEKKTNEAATALMAVGGIDAMQAVARRGRAGRMGGRRGMRAGRGGRRRGGAVGGGASVGDRAGAGGAR